MEKRFEQKTEAGGDSDAWIHHAFEQRETKLARDDDTDDNKLAGLDHNERTEFYMHVAQRFKDAGERVIAFIKGNPQVSPALQQRGAEEPKISKSQAMYTDEFEDDLSHVPDLKLPGVSAPPFDFAVQSKGSTSIRQRSSGGALSEPASIDDFDYPYNSNTEPATVFVGDGLKTVSYRPRLRDLLFASGVGSRLAVEHVSLKTDEEPIPYTQGNSAKEPLEHQEGKTEADQEIPELSQPNQDVLKTVKDAVDALLANEQVAVPADTADLSPEEPEMEGDTFEELAYQNLKPSVDGVRIVTSENAIIEHPKPVESSELENPFAERLQSSQTKEDNNTKTVAATEPESVSQILANRTKIPKPPKQHHHPRIPDVSRRRPSNNVMATVVIILIVLVALLLSSAV